MDPSLAASTLDFDLFVDESVPAPARVIAPEQKGVIGLA